MAPSPPTADHALPLVSVIIPTYNRKDSLLRALDSLSRQTYPPESFEVIVVDDGSSDGTAEALQDAGYLYALRYFRQSHLGVSAARNLGLDHALGELLLYVDDDMVLEPEVLAEHLAAHELHSGAVVKGQVILALDDPGSAFAAIQSGTPDIPLSDDKQLRPVSYQQIFAGHFSIRRQDALSVGGWSPEPREYGFQDLEFMYRCHTNGLAMWYAQSAITYHHDHATSLEKVCRRLERASESAARHLFVQYPELRIALPMFHDKGPIAWRRDPPSLILRKLARQVVSSRPVMWAMETSVPSLERRAPQSRLLVLFYRWIMSGYIYRGYRDGLRKQEVNA